MPTTTQPKRDNIYIGKNTMNVRGDNASVEQYLIETTGTTGATYSYVTEEQRFSNSGGLLYSYWAIVTGSTYGWVNEFGYDPIAVSVTITY